MSEMVERLAMVLVDGESLISERRARARAVLRALRDPTGEMKEAGAATYGVVTPAIGSLPLSVINGQPTKAWRAMIDEALK